MGEDELIPGARSETRGKTVGASRVYQSGGLRCIQNTTSGEGVCVCRVSSSSHVGCGTKANNCCGEDALVTSTLVCEGFHFTMPICRQMESSLGAVRLRFEAGADVRPDAFPACVYVSICSVR